MPKGKSDSRWIEPPSNWHEKSERLDFLFFFHSRIFGNRPMREIANRARCIRSTALISAGSLINPMRFRRGVYLGSRRKVGVFTGRLCVFQ